MCPTRDKLNKNQLLSYIKFGVENNLNESIYKYGYIYDGENKIDEVMVSFFKSPFSYTTENVVEINCHGGNVVIRKILVNFIVNIHLFSF